MTCPDQLAFLPASSSRRPDLLAALHMLFSRGAKNINKHGGTSIPRAYQYSNIITLEAAYVKMYNW